MKINFQILIDMCAEAHRGDKIGEIIVIDEWLYKYMPIINERIINDPASVMQLYHIQIHKDKVADASTHNK